VYSSLCKSSDGDVHLESRETSITAQRHRPLHCSVVQRTWLIAAKGVSLLFFVFLSLTHYINRVVTTKAKALKTHHETRKVASAPPLVFEINYTRTRRRPAIYMYTGYITFKRMSYARVYINRRSENRKTLNRGDRTMGPSAVVVYIIFIRRGSAYKSGNKKT